MGTQAKPKLSGRAYRIQYCWKKGQGVPLFNLQLMSTVAWKVFSSCVLLFLLWLCKSVGSQGSRRMAEFCLLLTTSSYNLLAFWCILRPMIKLTMLGMSAAERDEGEGREIHTTLNEHQVSFSLYQHNYVQSSVESDQKVAEAVGTDTI